MDYNFEVAIFLVICTTGQIGELEWEQGES
jgi:hypothetical protein